MRGDNSLTLNHATMIDIVQRWIDAELKAAPKVASVSYVHDGTPGNTFQVKLTDPEFGRQTTGAPIPTKAA